MIWLTENMFFIVVQNVQILSLLTRNYTIPEITQYHPNHVPYDMLSCVQICLTLYNSAPYMSILRIRSTCILFHSANWKRKHKNILTERPCASGNIHLWFWQEVPHFRNKKSQHFTCQMFALLVCITVENNSVRPSNIEGHFNLYRVGLIIQSVW